MKESTLNTPTESNSKNMYFTHLLWSELLPLLQRCILPATQGSRVNSRWSSQLCCRFYRTESSLKCNIVFWIVLTKYQMIGKTISDSDASFKAWICLHWASNLKSIVKLWGEYSFFFFCFVFLSFIGKEPWWWMAGGQTCCIVEHGVSGTMLICCVNQN